jgi:hypothetical protein
MARAALAAFAAVLALAAIPAIAHLTERREMIASTPSAYTGLTVPLPLPASGIACADEILFDTDARIARFGATAPKGEPAPPLEIEARGNTEGKWRSDYADTARIPGGWRGTRQFDLPLRPPAQAGFGTFCVRNLGDRPMSLVGSEDGRAYSRPTVKINGEPSPIELQLWLMEPGKRSLLARSGAVMEHASTLRPFGAWWWWLGALAVLALAPLGIGAAIRSAVVADGEYVRPTAAPWPSERVRRRLAAIPGPAIVAGAAAITFAFFAYWALNTHVFQNDEDSYVYLSRWLQDSLPQGLWDFHTYGRGLQRLEVWLLAVPSALFDSPASLIAGRLLNTLAFVSTVVPVYLLGRGLGLRPRWAALPAVLSIAVPWAVVTTAFLTENLAYPASVWAVWGIWRAAAEPSPGRDVLALGLLFVAGLARTGLLLLAPVLPLAALATALRCSSGDVAARLRGALRAHVVLWGAVGIAALALLAGAAGLGPDLASRLAGGYGTPFEVDLSLLLDKAGRLFARAVVGTGFFTAVIGLPWLVLVLARVREPGRFAFAVTALATALTVFYSVASASTDERYVMYLAPLLLLAATLALARREVSPAGVAVASVLLCALLVAVPWDDRGPFGFFSAPVETFFARAIGLRLGSHLPGSPADWTVVAALALGAAGVVLALVLRRRPAWLAGAPAVALVAAVAFAIVVQTAYTFSKYVNGVGSKTGAGLSERAFADRLVPAGASVGELAEGAGQEPPFFEIWQEVQFYNERIRTVFTLGRGPNPVPLGDQLVENVGFDDTTGRVISPRPLSDYLVIPTQVGRIRLRGEVIHAPTYIPVALIRVAEPPTLDWSASGFGPDGVPFNGPGTVRIYGAGRRPGAHCATLDLLGPLQSQGSWSFDVAGRPAGSGTVAANAHRVVRVDLPGLVEQGHVNVGLTGTARLIAVNVDAGC